VPAQRIAAALFVVVALACGIGCPAKEPVAARRVHGDGICEDVYAIDRAPGGRWDRIAVRRLAPCDGTDRDAPVVLYLPGMHMSGELARDERAIDFRRLLAAAGVHFWSVDYRTHAVPADAPADQLRALDAWTPDLFADDAGAAARLAYTTDSGPFYVAGFSFGAGIAYRLAARGRPPMAGLVILDGMPPDGRAPPAGDPAVDVGGSRLPYGERQRLLAAVLEDPAAPSPVAGFATAGDALADRIFTARSFGGAGGLSAAKRGVTDVRSLAALLATYDRWWPRAALGGAAVVPAERLRVLAFASTTMGSAWVERVRAGAVAFGGDDAQVHELPGHGHVDVLIGRDVGRLVVEPMLAFVRGTAH
jgi:pimeloyl-ACP methyl ester carboxylesterase